MPDIDDVSPEVDPVALLAAMLHISPEDARKVREAATEKAAPADDQGERKPD